MSTLGFIGLGNMGAPMAANLVAAGHDVQGFDLLEPNLSAAVEKGIGRASSARDACLDVDAIILMLPAGRHVLGVIEDVLPTLAAGTLVIDCSTIDVASSRTFHALCEGANLHSLDAPVSGGVGGAEAGMLTFMAGGSDEAFSLGGPILEPMAGRVVHCGESGSGQAAKICNNMLLGISMIGTAEAFLLAEKLDLSPQALFDVASTSSGRCWSLDTYCPVPGPVPASPANRGYQPGFATPLMLKDLRLAQEAATSGGAHTPMGAQAAQLYALFSEHGGADLDFSAIIEFLRGQRSRD